MPKPDRRDREQQVVADAGGGERGVARSGRASPRRRCPSAGSRAAARASGIASRSCCAPAPIVRPTVSLRCARRHRRVRERQVLRDQLRELEPARRVLADDAHVARRVVVDEEQRPGRGDRAPSRRPRPRPDRRARWYSVARVVGLDMPGVGLVVALGDRSRAVLLRTARTARPRSSSCCRGSRSRTSSTRRRRRARTSYLQGAATPRGTLPGLSICFASPPSTSASASGVAIESHSNLSGHTPASLPLGSAASPAGCAAAVSLAGSERRPTRTSERRIDARDGSAAAPAQSPRVERRGQSVERGDTCRGVVHEAQLGDLGDRLGEREQRARACAPRRGGSSPPTRRSTYAT